MRIGIIGAGVLGSVFAGRLAAAGNQVTLIARGQRLSELRSGPLVLINDGTGQSVRVNVGSAEALAPEDTYDLVLVLVRANQLASVLPELAANGGVRTFLVMNNRANGSAPLVTAVGEKRLLLGFPGAGGSRDGNTVHYDMIAEQPTTLGEIDGSSSATLHEIGFVLRMAGFKTVTSRHMDDWLKVHAVFVTAVAGAIYACDGSTSEVALNSTWMRTLVAAIKQGFDTLREAGVIVEPRMLAFLFRLPGWVPEQYWRRYLLRPSSERIFARHALAAPDEMQELVTQLRGALPGAFDLCPSLQCLWRAVADKQIDVAGT